MTAPEVVESLTMHPILTTVGHSLSEVLAKIQMPALPALSPKVLQARGIAAELTDTDAYIINSLPIALWGQCMTGLDFMHGIRATVAADTYLSCQVLARAALESFAFAFWVGDDRLGADERYRRALLLNRESVLQERKRHSRHKPLDHPGHPESKRMFDDRLRRIDDGIAHFGRKLDEAGIAHANGVPNKNQAVQNILTDVSPIADALYGTLSAVVHGDQIFTWGLLHRYTDGVRPLGSDKHVLLTTSITNHLTPTWHAVVAMCIALEVAYLVLEIEYDRDAMTDLSKDMMDIVVQHGDEPIWRLDGGTHSECGST